MPAPRDKQPLGVKQPELCLRFRCTHCQEVLVMPVRNLAGAKNDCPTCAQPVLFPALTQAVAGFTEVVSAGHEGPTRALGCPVCHSRLELNGDPLGTGKRCPRCREWLVFKLVPEKRAGDKPPPQNPTPVPSPASERPSSQKSASEPRQPPINSRPPATNNSKPSDSPKGKKSNSARPPAAPPSAKTSRPAPEPRTAPPPSPPCNAAQQASVEEAVFFDEPPPPQVPPRPKATPRRTPEPAPASHSHGARPLPEDLPSPVLYDGSQAGNPTSTRRHSGGGLSSSPRLMRAILFFGLQLGGPAMMIALTGMSGYTSFTVLGVLWFLFGWLPSFWIVHYMVPAFITHIRCPGCYEDYEAVDIWKCSCGYQDHKQRHMLSFHCPVCRKWLARMDCYRCGSTILVR